MSRRAAYGIVFIFMGGFLLSYCGGPRRADQIKFGIWAAEKELWDEAIFRWKKVLLSSPDSVAAHNNLAVAYEKKGLWEEARKEYEIALKLEPENSWVKSNFQNFQENLEPPEKKKKEEGEKDEKK